MQSLGKRKLRLNFSYKALKKSDNMAPPIITIPNWVLNNVQTRILFVTENYPRNPNDITNNTFFYRTLNPIINLNGANNLIK